MELPCAALPRALAVVGALLATVHCSSSHSAGSASTSTDRGCASFDAGAPCDAAPTEDGAVDQGRSETGEAVPPAEDAAVDQGRAEAGEAVPPADCIAPCVWELMRHCSPVGECTSDTRPGSAFEGQIAEVTCAPENDYWSVFEAMGGTRDVRSVFAAGQLCYRVASSKGTGADRFITFTDPSGAVVARAYRASGDSSVIVACDPPEPRGICLDPSGPGCQATDLSQPHCAPWRTACTTGTCSGDPPSL